MGPMGHRLGIAGLDVVVPEVVEARGCVVTTADGRELVDLESGVWCAGLGHHHPAVDAALAAHVGMPQHAGYRWSHPMVERAARRLCEVTGLPDGAAVLLASGSEAVGLAVRIAGEVTDRSTFLRLDGHYLSAYGRAGAPAGDRWLTADALDGLDRRAADALLDGVAAVVLEPGNASGVVRIPPPGSVRRLADAVRERGGLVVVDEVTTGFGRTGEWFGFEHEGLVPDVVAVGKGCGNGYPVSAVVVSGAVAARVAASGMRYAQSHQDDPAGAAVVLAVIDAIEREDLVRRSRETGAWLRERLAAIGAPGVTDVRGRGLMCAFDVRPGRATAVQAALLDRGYLVGANAVHRTIRVYPPLVVSRDQLDGFVRAVADVTSAP